MFNKITNRFNIQLLVTIIFSTTSLPILYAQKNSEPQVIKEYALYKQSLKNDSLKKMVELKQCIFAFSGSPCACPGSAGVK
jgi:hypothetical protein